MSQNVWATIMPFGPVTLIFYWPKKNFSAQPKAGPHFRHCKCHCGFKAYPYPNIMLSLANWTLK